MKRFLVKSLVVPLSLGAALCMLASFWLRDPWRSLFVNLAASFLGSIITVFFVEKILRSGEERKWERFREHAGKQITFLATRTASSIREALAIPLPDRWKTMDVVDNPPRIRQMMIEMIEQDLLPAIAKMEQMSQDDWQTLASTLRDSVRNCEVIFSLFGAKLGPEITALILDLHERIRRVLAPLEFIPDLSSGPVVKALRHQATQDAEKLLRICVALLREVGRTFLDQDIQRQRATG
jgi:hypothetical protein